MKSKERIVRNRKERINKAEEKNYEIQKGG